MTRASDLNADRDGPMAPAMCVRCIDPASDPAWLELLGHPAAGLFHSPPWLRAVADAYGFAIRAYLVADAEGSLLGGIPFCEIDDLIGRRVVALPFTDVCDPLVPSIEVWHLMFAGLRSHGVPVHLRCFQGPIADGDGLTVVKSARWHRLSIEPTPERIWSGMAGCTRRAIRMAERAGVEVRPLEGAGACEDFHRLHVELRKRKYRLLAQPASFFQALANRFGAVDGWHPLGAFLNGRLIAATILLRWDDILYFKFNASAADGLAVRPNNLLVWAGIVLGRSLGCRALDLGPSDDDQPGLIRFKRNFGADVRELRFLRWTPPGFPTDRGTDVQRLLRELTNLLTAPDVPDEVAARAGALLYGFFA